MEGKSWRMWVFWVAAVLGLIALILAIITGMTGVRVIRATSVALLLAANAGFLISIGAVLEEIRNAGLKTRS
ncbi:MAG: hypothetical protein Q8O86_05145 [Dehalococcoidia bacterium]|nr:hypothetical protein [Dehalococcoidia bacterium]